MSELEVFLSRRECTEVLLALEEVVVSLEQLKRRHGGGRNMVQAQWDYFCGDGDRAWERLADARKVLRSAEDRAFGADVAAAMCDGLQYWPDLHPGE